jgi:hypothetical protein
MINTTNDQQAAYLPAAQPSESVQNFELAQREALAWSKGEIVPKAYKGNVPNCIIALDVARRLGASPLQVMQNLYVVHGTPSWSSTFLIAAVNHCGRYGSLRYEEKGEPGSDDYGVRAWAVEKSSGERLNGSWITWKMVKAEQWLDKAGSKWKTMPEQMFRYRAAAFWQRTYAPEIGMGFQTVEEVQDVATPREVPPGTMTIRWSAKQMAEAKFEVETMGKSTAQDILDKHGETMPEDQRAEVATWEYKGQ